MHCYFLAVHLLQLTLQKELYQLFPGNWITKIADLGNIRQGSTIEDTYFAVKEVTSELIKRNIIPIIIGGGQDLTYANYRAYDVLEQTVNIVSVDNSSIQVVQIACCEVA